MTAPEVALVTGFGPFLDVTVNPSELLARRVEGRRIGAAVVRTVVLPVSYSGAPAALEEAIRDARPACVVAVGAGRGEAIALEERAANQASSIHADNSGVVHACAAIEASGPSTRECALPVSRWARELATERAPVIASRDAGAYVCNATYFSLLGQPALRRRALFVHLPRRTDDGSIDAAARVVLALIDRMLTPGSWS